MPTWIKITDHLPEPELSDELLFYNGRVHSGFYCFNDSTWNDDYEVEVTGVTHWAIPEPPLP